MDVSDDLEAGLVGRRDVVAVGIGRELLPALLAARRRTDGGTWRLLCSSAVVDALGRAFVLGTDLATWAADGGGIDLRTSDGSATDRTLIATPDRAIALTGPEGNRTLLVERAVGGGSEDGEDDGAGDGDENGVERLHRTARAWFDGGTPATVGMPSRERLVSSARSALDERFAAELTDVLDALGPGDLDRSRPVTDRTLLVALAARHDHLFNDVGTWAASVGVTPRQTLTADRRALERGGLIETVKVPMGIGHPHYRLRAVDERLLRVPPARLVDLLRDRLGDVDVGGAGAGGSTEAGGGAPSRPVDDRPVWDRKP